MKETRNRTTKTIALSVGRALASLGSIVIAVALSRLCDEHEYATYRQTFLIFKMMAPFLGLGLAQSLLYFLPSEKERGRGIVVENLCLLLFTGTLYLMLMIFGGNELIAKWFNNPALATTLLILAPIALAQLPLASIGPCLIANDKVGLAAAFGAISRIGIVVATLIVFLLFFDIRAALWAHLLATAVACGVAVFLMLRICRNGLPSFAGVQKQVAYGVPLGIATMVAAISKYIDRTMVSVLCPTRDYAIFENGAFEIPLISIITGSMTAILLVDYRSMIAEERSAEILPIMHRAMIKSGTILLPAMMFLLCIAPEFLVCLFGERYLDSASVFRVYLLLLPVRCLSFGAVAMAAGKSKHVLAVALCSLTVNGFLNYFAVVNFGYVGAAVATVITIYLVGAIGRMLIAQNVLKCSAAEFIPWRRFGQLFAMSSVPVPIVLLVLYQLDPNYYLLRLVLAMAIYGLVVVPVLIYTKFVDYDKIRQRLNRWIIDKKDT